MKKPLLTPSAISHVAAAGEKNLLYDQIISSLFNFSFYLSSIFNFSFYLSILSFFRLFFTFLSIFRFFLSFVSFLLFFLSFHSFYLSFFLFLLDFMWGGRHENVLFVSHSLRSIDQAEFPAMEKVITLSLDCIVLLTWMSHSQKTVLVLVRCSFLFCFFFDFRDFLGSNCFLCLYNNGDVDWLAFLRQNEVHMDLPS